jgi:hypothetical protein
MTRPGDSGRLGYAGDTPAGRRADLAGPARAMALEAGAAPGWPALYSVKGLRLRRVGVLLP